MTSDKQTTLIGRVRPRVARAIHPEMRVWKRDGDIVTPARELEASVSLAESATDPSEDDILRIARDWDRLKQRLGVWPDER